MAWPLTTTTISMPYFAPASYLLDRRRPDPRPRCSQLTRSVGGNERRRDRSSREGMHASAYHGCSPGYQMPDRMEMSALDSAMRLKRSQTSLVLSVPGAIRHTCPMLDARRSTSARRFGTILSRNWAHGTRISARLGVPSSRHPASLNVCGGLEASTAAAGEADTRPADGFAVLALDDVRRTEERVRAPGMRRVWEGDSHQSRQTARTRASSVALGRVDD
ncbi:hypothetical protein C8T65DRAFT_694545 [Cerioporus squamosus]|nr:hypothetical protein C8T65DRAFT_694545 [Cerioporus squamosus]